MLKNRVIPCLLLRNSGLVKTVKFKDPIYVGDPINAIRIFNDKEVDELIFLDILGRPGRSESPLLKRFQRQLGSASCRSATAEVLTRLRTLRRY